MSQEPTRGPWRAVVRNHSAWVVADEPVPGIQGSDATDYYGGHLIAESMTPANAVLAAAAWDLLEALKGVGLLLVRSNIAPSELCWCRDDFEIDELGHEPQCEAARAAIAKAEGR